MPVVKGTKDRKNASSVKSQDKRTIRCTNPKCKNIAALVPDGKGGQIHKCFACGNTFTFSTI